MEVCAAHRNNEGTPGKSELEFGASLLFCESPSHPSFRSHAMNCDTKVSHYIPRSWVAVRFSFHLCMRMSYVFVETEFRRLPYCRNSRVHVQILVRVFLLSDRTWSTVRDGRLRVVHAILFLKGWGDIFFSHREARYERIHHLRRDTSYFSMSRFQMNIIHHLCVSLSMGVLYCSI